MLKKISALLCAICLIIAFPLAVLADTSAVKLIDEAQLLSSSEYEEVLGTLENVSSKYDVDIAVLTVDGLNGKDIVSFSDDYYDEHGYGTGEDNSGVLWVIDMGSRESYITTSGEGISAVTDYGKDLLAGEVNPYLSAGDYRGAMVAYADTMDRYFDAERKGQPVDTYEQETEPEAYERSAGDYAAGGAVSLGAGFGLSFAATSGMKRKMKSVRRQTSASAYADPHGLNLRENTDRYLYHRIVAVPLPRNDGPRNGPQGGGSSVHMSSGGHMHGGGSLGKF